jgi:hypothetical protein
MLCGECLKGGDNDNNKIHRPFVKMSSTFPEAFVAIKAFVDDLVIAFNANRKSPLGYYSRIIDCIKPNEKGRIDGVIDGFVKFFQQYKTHLTTNGLKDFDKFGDIKISLGNSDNAYIQLSSFVAKGPEATRSAIASHLLVIASFLETDPAMKERISRQYESLNPDFLKTLNLDTSSDEGKFIANLFANVQNLMKGGASPMDMIANLSSTGGMEKMIGSLLGTEGAPKINKKKMMKLLKQMIVALIPDDDGDSDEELTLTLPSTASSLPPPSTPNLDGATASSSQSQLDMDALTSIFQNLATNTPK